MEAYTFIYRIRIGYSLVELILGDKFQLLHNLEGIFTPFDVFLGV